MAQNLGPWHGVYKPGYQIGVFKNGDPRSPVRGVDWRSVTRLSTQKLLTDIVGTFSITLKDARARLQVGPMDVLVIRLHGHNQGWATVLKCVVDGVGPADTASVSGAEQDTIITGRCMGKYLQVNSMFLPVWSTQANLPTALTFGAGDASQKLGTNINVGIPRQIFHYIYVNFVIGLQNAVGLSGTPNAQFWLNPKNRFDWVGATNGKPFSVPFVQFDEDTCDTALTRLVVQGFTEGWIDETGNIVYRRPGWDLPVSWNLHTDGIISDTLQDTDVGLSTYVEVFPGAFPGVASGVAQAMLAGRAPIPSDYVTGLQTAGFKSIASPEFIIDTDKNGQPTAKGKANWYYQQQRKYGLRPYQITSPLLASREQAQAQAEGLLRQLLRWQKSGTVTIPGEPNVRLGQTLYLYGALRGQKVARTYYIEGISQEYVEGDHYTTTLTLTHGRDPWDPHWIDVALPQFSASQLAEAPGILQPSGSGSAHNSSTTTTTPVSPGGYVNPFSQISGLKPERIDMGVDYWAPAGSVIVAIGNGRVTASASSGTGWSSPTDTQAGIVYQLTDGAYAGKYVYFTEDLQILVPSGQTITAGQPIAKFLPSSTGLECGWSTGTSFGPLAAQLGQQNPNGDPGAWTSAAGASFNRLLVSLGAPSGISQGAPHGTMPAGYP